MYFCSWHCFIWGLRPVDVQSSLLTEIILVFSDHASNPSSIKSYSKVYFKSINEVAQIGVAFAIFVYNFCHPPDLRMSAKLSMTLLQ